MRYPKCGQNIEDNWFCPFCGYEISNNDLENIAETDDILDEYKNKILI